MLTVTIVASVHLVLLVTLLVNLRELIHSKPSEASTAALPLLSVLIPARNEATNLGRLLPELLGQDYADFEVIVYDDDSSDGTDEVLAAHADPRLRVLRGDKVPAGWVGKVHALYRATRMARGKLYLFLDADVRLPTDRSLANLAARYQRLPGRAVLTGLTHLMGSGLLLVSLVPNAVLTTHPWPLLRRSRIPGLGALNGQCWMLTSALYHAFEPHRAFPDEVLEDVQIGRYLYQNGVIPHLVDVRDEVLVHMYGSFGDAWRGFRKNAYLLMGGHPLPFLFFGGLFFAALVAGPFVHPLFLGSIYLFKLVTDRVARMPGWVTLLAPVSILMALILQWDSAIHHWTNRVEWKGRRV